MNQKQFKKILHQIAADNNVTVEEVRRDMEFAMNEAKNNPDPTAQAKWAAIPCKGESPTLEEFITHVAGTIKRDMEGGNAK